MICFGLEVIEPSVTDVKEAFVARVKERGGGSGERLTRNEGEEENRKDIRTGGVNVPFSGRFPRSYDFLKRT